jgi:hypothetical protein
MGRNAVYSVGSQPLIWGEFAAYISEVEEQQEADSKQSLLIV